MLGSQLRPDATLESLADSYRRLQSFGDVLPALVDLHRAGHELVAFSVAPRLWLEDLTSEYRRFVPRLVSAEDAGVYKPHPGIYQHLLRTTSTSPSEALLVSSNPFDLIGGGSVAWVPRGADATPGWSLIRGDLGPTTRSQRFWTWPD